MRSILDLIRADEACGEGYGGGWIITAMKLKIAGSQNQTMRKTATAMINAPPNPIFRRCLPTGSHCVPLHRHRPSGDTAGCHRAPSHQYLPSAENFCGPAEGGWLMRREPFAGARKAWPRGDVNQPQHSEVSHQRPAAAQAVETPRERPARAVVWLYRLGSTSTPPGAFSPHGLT